MDCVGELEMNKFIVNPANENEILSIEGCRDEIDRLNQKLQKKQKIIDKICEKCQSQKGCYDFDVWMKLNDSWKTLSGFAEKIKYNLHPIITSAYQCDIKNSINEIIEVTKNDVVLKEDILEILKEK